MVPSFPRPVIATSIISLFSVLNPVSAHPKTPSRPRAHAAAIHQRSFNDVGVDFARRGNVPREVNERGLLGVLGDVVTVVVNGVTSIVNGADGGTTTTTVNQPANSTPAATPTTTQGTGGGNTGSPGNPGNAATTTTAANGSGNPTTQHAQTTQNAQTNAPSAIASNPNQQTSKARSETTDSNGSIIVAAGTGSVTRSSGASGTGPTDNPNAQNAIANGTGNVQKSTAVETITHLTTLPDGSVSTSIEVTTSIVDIPRNGTQPDDGGKGPSPVLIGVIVTFFVLSLLFGIGLFIWRRKKKHQAILLSSSNSSVRSSFVSDGWPHGREPTMVATETKERKKPGTPPTSDPFSHHAVRPYSPSVSSSNLSFDTSNILLPPDGTPVLSRFNQYPTPGSYPAFAIIVPESSSEGHSSRQERSAATHYEADTETFEPSAPSARSGGSFVSPATTEQTFHTALHEQRRALSPTQRLSMIESIRTPRASVLNPGNPFGDGALRPSVDSGASIAVDYIRPVAPSPLASTFGPSGEPQPSSPFVTGGGRDAVLVRNSYLTRDGTIRSNKTGSTVTLSPAPTRQGRPGRGGSVNSTTSTDEFYSAASHESPSLSHGHDTSNGQTSSSGHYITAPENPFADPSPQGSNEDSRYSTASQTSAISDANYAHVVRSRGISTRAVVTATRPNQTLRPETSSSGQSIVSSEPDPDAARCVSPDESELFYRPLPTHHEREETLPTHREREERPSDDTTVAEETRPPISAKAKKILGVHR